MNKKLFLLSLTMCTALCLAISCSNSPEAVAEKALAALKKGDYDAYAATFDLSLADQKMLSGYAEEKIDGKIADVGGIKSYKIIDTEVNGDVASVSVLVKYKNGEEETTEMDFCRVDGKWKQDMNK